MGIKYVWVNWGFDQEKFKRDIIQFKQDNNLNGQELYQLLGFQSAEHKAHWHPLMANFVAICNLCELDPRDYFILDDDA